MIVQLVGKMHGVNSFHKFILALLVLVTYLGLGATQEASDAYLTIMETFAKYNYEGEEHETVTEDGYILKMQRLLPKINRTDANLPPVMLVHGLMGSSENFIIVGPKRSLPYLLADRGYEVWLPNCRGNFHSRKHVTLDPDNNKTYWHFSWHEIGKYDLPAMIDYILETTNKSQIIYGGHSQGTTVFYVMASERPEYQSKVKLSMSLAPSVFLEHTKQPMLRAVSKYYRYWHNLVSALNQYEFIPFIPNNVARGLTSYMCQLPGPMQYVCRMLVLMLIGSDPEQLEPATIPIVYAQIPAGASAWQFLHYAQSIVSGEFKQYDFGKRINMKRYNSKTPPYYNLNITTPIGLFYAKNDMLNDVEDVENLSRILPNVVKLYKVPYEFFTHFDFVMAKDVVPFVYKEVLKLIEGYENKTD
ncbi:lipase 3 [Aethina tumida]|uniref:lipase 3 n=1 Tax=Aethina tumida TaxID=116153 RepID=UPI00096ADC7F|nr:lipase 3 [Aethina tumida]